MSDIGLFTLMSGGKKVSIKGWEKIQCDKWLLETRMNEAVSVLNKIHLLLTAIIRQLIL